MTQEPEYEWVTTPVSQIRRGDVVRVRDGHCEVVGSVATSSANWAVNWKLPNGDTRSLVGPRDHTMSVRRVKQ